MKFYLIIFKLHALETGIHLDPQYPIDSRESEIIRLKHGKNVYPPLHYPSHHHRWWRTINQRLIKMKLGTKPPSKEYPLVICYI